MQSCIRSAPGCFGSPAPVWFSALFPEVPHLRPILQGAGAASTGRATSIRWSCIPQKKGRRSPHAAKKRERRYNRLRSAFGALHGSCPYASKKRGRRYSRHNKVLRTLHGSFPYAQAGRPPAVRDTTQVSDKFYTVNKIVSLRQSQVLLWYKGLS